MTTPGAPTKPGFLASVVSSWETSTGKAVIVANLIPAAGLLFFHWDVFSVVFLYWFENVLIGIFQVARMALAEGGLPELPANSIVLVNGKPTEMNLAGKMNVGRMLKYFLIPFFCVHYGAFTWGHGTFIRVLFGKSAAGFNAVQDVGLAMGVLFGIYLFLFVKDTLIGEERKTDSVVHLMTEPYRRVAILHVFIIGSAFLVNLLHVPVEILLSIVFIKTAWDCRARQIRKTGLPVPS